MIADVQLTDNFDQWRQKTNQVIDLLNNLAVTGNALVVNTPSAAQILVYDGTFFRNVTVSGDITIDQTGHMVVANGGLASRGRNFFSGCIRGLY